MKKGEESKFYKYILRGKSIHIGDRIKKGLFKPCVDFLRATTITFALRRLYNDRSIYAIGLKIKGRKKILTRNIIDRFTNAGKLTGDRGPIHIEYIEDPECEVYINKYLGKELIVSVGGFRTIGFGDCKLSFQEEVIPEIKKIILDSAFPFEWKKIFGFKNEVGIVRIGYLFVPFEDDWLNGEYKKSYFPQSELIAFSFLSQYGG